MHHNHHSRQKNLKILRIKFGSMSVSSTDSVLRYIFSDKVLALEKPETSLRISPIMPSGCGIYVGRRITKASIRIRLSKTTTKNFWFLSGTDFIFTVKYLIYGMCIYKIFMYNKI